MTLFDSESLPGSHEGLGDGAVLLRSFARSEAPALLEEVARIVQAVPPYRPPKGELWLQHLTLSMANYQFMEQSGVSRSCKDIE
jgi:hypothetical protein